MDLENKSEPKEKKSLDDRQRKAIAIVLAIIGVTVLLGWNMKLSANLEEIKTQQDMIQGELAGISGSVSSEMAGFRQEVSDMLKAQDSLLADYSVREISRDLKAGTVKYSLSVIPKTYQPGMKVSFAINDGHDTVEVQGKENKHAFTATVACGFTDYIAISAFLHQSDKTQIQALEKYEGMLSETYLVMNEDFYGFLWNLNPKEIPTVDKTMETFIFIENNDENSKTSEVHHLDYYVLVNQKIVASPEVRTGTQTWYGEEEEVIQGYKTDVPLGFIKNLKAGDQIELAVLVTDSNGRRYCGNYASLHVKYCNQKYNIELDDQYSMNPSFGVDFK